jgi:hypothetical protein
MAMSSTQHLTEIVKGCWHVRLTTSSSSVNRLSRENVGASTSHNAKGLYGVTGIALPLPFKSILYSVSSLSNKIYIDSGAE